MDLIQIIEIFAFVTGIAYIVLEILQKNAMYQVAKVLELQHQSFQ